MTTSLLWNAGTGNNGLLIGASPLTLLSTELNGLVNNGTALSSVGGAGSAGVFTNADFGQAMMGQLSLTLGAIGTALSAGAAIAGWFLTSVDGGTTYENVVSGATLSRPPDFVIALPATTITAGWSYNSPRGVEIPALVTKVFIQNLSGQTLAASGNTIKIAPYGMIAQ